MLTEVMTDMFLQCGLLIEADIIEMDKYQDFLEVLHHHTFMENVSTTQLTHFIMLMTYMAFCRFSPYTKYMEDRDALLLQSKVWMNSVVMSLKNHIFYEEKSSQHKPLLQELTNHSEKKLTCHYNQIYGTGLHLSKSCAM